MEILHVWIKTGMVWRPARREARHLRSPAISSNSSDDPSPMRRTRMGWSTPSSLIDAANDDIVSSSKLIRG
jgi:hypothetical protein